MKHDYEQIEFSIDKANPQTINIGAFKAQGAARIGMWCSGTFCVCTDIKSAKELVFRLNKLSDQLKRKLIV